MKTRNITIIAILTVILFVQEQVLVFLPNISLTVFLIVLYSKVLGFKKTTIIILIYVLLDNLYMASFSLYFFPFMFIGWELIPIIFCSFFKKIENSFILALGAVLCSFLYCFIYFIPNYVFLEIDLVPYFIADLPFEFLLSGSSFLTTLWLYPPVKRKLLELYLKN